MKRPLYVMLIALLFLGCSTPRPAQQPDKVRSGKDTAKTAADAARKAEADNDTGLLVASSNSAKSAQVMVYSKPEGVVVVNGESTELTTPAPVPLAPGKWDVQVQFPSGMSSVKTVEVKDGSRIKLFFGEQGPASQPAVKGPTLRVSFVKGTLTQSGEPIVNFAEVCKQAVATDPNTALIIEADAATKHGLVTDAIDTAKAAGIQKFSVRVTDAEPVKAPSKDKPKGEVKEKKDEGKDAK